MAGLPTALFWRRLDTAGSEHVLYSDRAGLRAKGTMLAATPVPFACRYELYTDDAWATARFEVTVEGAGFLRSVRLERAAGRWRVTATEQGNLDAALLAAGHPRAALPGSEEPAKLVKALDVDLGFTPLTNTLPIQRLKLEPGESREIRAVYIELPQLSVSVMPQRYTRLGDRLYRYQSEGFQADLSVDEFGLVVDYPGLWRRLHIGKCTGAGRP